MRNSTSVWMGSLLVGMVLWLPVPTWGGSVISIHFLAAEGEGGDPEHLIPSSDIAGVIPVANWNNVQPNPPYDSIATQLLDSSGTATTASVVGSALNTWSYGPIPYSNPDSILMSSYLDGGSGGTPGVDAHVTVTGVPYSKYDVYVYFSDDNTTANPPAGTPVGTTGVYTLTDGNGSSQTTYGWDPGVRFAGTFIQSTGAYNGDPNAKGNYLIFTGIATPDFSLNATTLGGYLRAPIDGIQIVSVPEPSSLLLLLAGCFVTVVPLSRRRGIDD